MATRTPTLAASLALCLTATAGCLVEAPVVLQTGAAPLDIDAAVGAFERALCKDGDSDACRVLATLDESDGTREAPARLPIAIPRMIASPIKDGALEVASWLRDAGFEDAIAPSIEVAVDLAALGFDAHDLAGVSLQAVSIVVVDGALDLPAGGASVFLAPAADGDELVQIGVVEALPRDTGDAAPLWLVAGGAARIADALSSGRVDVVVQPSFEALRMNVDETAWSRPRGAARIAVRLEVSLPIDARALAMAAATR